MAEVRYVCTVCDGLTPHNFLCDGCGAIAFCSKKHAETYWQAFHKHECAKCKLQMANKQELMQFPFPWASKVCKDHNDLPKFLCDLNLKDNEVFQTLLPRIDRVIFGSLGFKFAKNVQQAQAQSLTEICSLPDNFHISSSQNTKAIRIGCWRDFYTALEIPLQEPIGLCLDLIATISHIISSSPKLLSKRHLEVHIVGCEGEIDRWPMLLISAIIWPGKQFKFLLNGVKMDPNLKDCLIRAKYLGGQNFNFLNGSLNSGEDASMAFQFQDGLYHEIPGNFSSSPDLILCPNAGIAVYGTWKATIQNFLKGSAEVVITDYSEEAINLAHEIATLEKMRDVTSCKTIFAPKVNPLRRPLNSHGRDNILPSFSNGFMFYISETVDSS